MKMADAADLDRLHGVEGVGWALGHAATFDRFADGNRRHRLLPDARDTAEALYRVVDAASEGSRPRATTRKILLTVDIRANMRSCWGLRTEERGNLSIRSSRQERHHHLTHNSR